MRQAFLLALTISLVLMSGCKSRAQQEEHFTSWKEQFLLSGDVQITAVVTASDEESASRYKLLYERKGDAESVEVIEPELISKVKAHIKDGKTELSYDGAVLETGSVVGERFSPMTALPVFVDFLEDGYLKDVWIEKTDGEDTLTAELELPDGSRMLLWIDEGSGRAIAASIRSGEVAELMIEF